MSEDFIPDRYWVEFVNSDREVLFRYSTVDDSPEVDIPAVLSVCDFLPESSPDIVYSMEMGPYYVDVVSCFDLCCVSIVDQSSTDRSRATVLIPLTAMIVVAFEMNSSKGSGIDFSRILFHPNAVEMCFELFSSMTEGSEVEYFSLVSSSGNVYTTFGNFRGSANSLCLGWDRILGVLEEFEEGVFVMSEDCDFVAAVNFLPFLKFCVFFDERISRESAAESAAAFYERAMTIVPAIVQVFWK
jgi:hypothetical protein